MKAPPPSSKAKPSSTLMILAWSKRKAARRRTLAHSRSAFWSATILFCSRYASWGECFSPEAVLRGAGVNRQLALQRLGMSAVAPSEFASVSDAENGDQRSSLRADAGTKRTAAEAGLSSVVNGIPSMAGAARSLPHYSSPVITTEEGTTQASPRNSDDDDVAMVEDAALLMPPNEERDGAIVNEGPSTSSSVSADDDTTTDVSWRAVNVEAASAWQVPTAGIDLDSLLDSSDFGSPTGGITDEPLVDVSDDAIAALEERVRRNGSLKSTEPEGDDIVTVINEDEYAVGSFPLPKSSSDPDGDENGGKGGNNNNKGIETLRSLWRRRHAKSAEEGIRRQKVGRRLEEKKSQLSSILDRAGSIRLSKRRYAARTISGLIHALAEEVHDLEVEVQARPRTPLWFKQVDQVKIKFSKLMFKPLSIGGRVVEDDPRKFPDTMQGAWTEDRQLAQLDCADEAFERMDVDKSGALDRDEIAQALSQAAGLFNDALCTVERKKQEIVKGLASELVALYDRNGDGVVDRTEYQSMVEDMAALRDAQEKERTEERRNQNATDGGGWLASARSSIGGFVSRISSRSDETGDVDILTYDEMALADAILRGNADFTNASTSNENDESPLASKSNPLENETALSVASNATTTEEVACSGSITLSDLKLDLSRLAFGAIPVVKHITPGGPLVLEPFTVTVSGSFNRGDIMESTLLDDGLRRLVTQALKRRVRGVRDLMDGAVFHGRRWKMGSGSAPIIQVPELINVEFDKRNRLIVTGRARIQPRQEVPIIEQSFKLRTKLGTRKGGQFIRLVEPELALVLECPKKIEEGINRVYDSLEMKRPRRPKPIYRFVPLYSKFKIDDNDGFDLGEDNRIKSIYVEDNALRFELSAVLRPGRFLGNHYLAFTVPQRTFIVTLERVFEGMRAARKAKKETRAMKRLMRKRRALEEATSGEEDHGGRRLWRWRRGDDKPQKRARAKSFFSRFVDGYLQTEDNTPSTSEGVTTAIRDFFGRQG